MSTTLAVRRTQTLPERPLRVRPAPRSEPPTDAERASTGLDAPAASAPVLPLELPGAGQPRPRQARNRPHGSGEGEAAPDAFQEGNDATPGPAELDPSPIRQATRRFLATCVEVIGGFRPLGQLRPLCAPDQFLDIADRLAAHPATGPAWRRRAIQVGSPARAQTPVAGRSTGAPPRAGRAYQTAPVDRVSVRRVQVCEVIDGVAEIAVVMARREQVWAMAMRLERQRGQWLCTHLEVV